MPMSLSIEVVIILWFVNKHVCPPLFVFIYCAFAAIQNSSYETFHFFFFSFSFFFQFLFRCCCCCFAQLNKLDNLVNFKCLDCVAMALTFPIQLILLVPIFWFERLHNNKKTNKQKIRTYFMAFADKQPFMRTR